MAKRFISTEIFDDDWFMDLKPESKLLWLYFITKCDHAGIINFNERLCKFQTGLNDVQSCLKSLKSRLHKISETQFFIPKFIYFQYPDFPNSKVNQQKGAIKILEKYGLIDENQHIKITPLKDVKRVLNPYDNDNVNVSDNVNVNDNIENKKNELNLPNTEFDKFIIWLDKNCSNVQKLKEPITEDQFFKLKVYSPEIVKEVLMAMHNHKDLLKKYNSAYLTALNWLKKIKPENESRLQQTIDVRNAVIRKIDEI